MIQPRAEQNGDVVSYIYLPERTWSPQSEFFVWDLDKTYLDTSWHNLGELIRVAREKAFQKKNVPGTLSLVQGLKRTWLSTGKKEPFPIAFVTASPPQMEEKIREKLLLDDLLPVCTFFKDNLKNLSFKRWRRLTQQVGYKIQALLQLRKSLRQDVRQTFWGDDSESDAVIYSLYSDLCARRFTDAEFRELLGFFKVSGEQVATIMGLRDEVPEGDPVERIYINLATDTDPEYYLKFGWRIFASYNTFQTALDMFQAGKLSLEETLKVAQDMIWNYGFSPDELTAALNDLLRRRLLTKGTLEQIYEPLSQEGLILSDIDGSKWAQERLPWEGEGSREERWIRDQVDYFNDWR